MVEIRSIAPRIGAEVVGVDVTKLDDETFAAIYEAFINASCLVIRDQDLSKADFLVYSRRFGPLEPHASKNTRDDDYAELTVMVAEPAKMGREDGKPMLMRGEGWHTDTPYWKKPAKATQLYGVTIPSDGGDTLIANATAAYDALPEKLKSLIDGMRARFRYRGKTGDLHGFLEGAEKLEPVEHPIVARHPETGRKSLYVNPVHTVEIVGLGEAESDALLEELYSHLVQPDAEYRHKWQPGDILIWDNRSAVHSATGGYTERREMWRVTIR